LSIGGIPVDIDMKRLYRDHPDSPPLPLADLVPVEIAVSATLLLRKNCTVGKGSNT
jgi:hypothetical protein